MLCGAMYVADIMLLVYGVFVTYSTHSNLSVMYNWGVLVGVMVAVQIVSGVIIAWSYVASYEHTFLVVDYMLRDGELM